MNIEPSGPKAMSVGRLNGPPPCVTFFHAAELKSSAGTPVSERAPFSPMVCSNVPSVVNFWNCWWCSPHSQTTSLPFSRTMRIACGKVNSPAPQDDRKLPSRSKITIGSIFFSLWFISLLELLPQLGHAVEYRQNLVRFCRRHRKVHPCHTEIAVALQHIRVFRSPAQGHRQRGRIAPGLFGHLAEARQIIERISVTRTAGDREPAVAI